MSTMNVVKKQGPGRGIEITTDAIPEPAPDEVLIKVNIAGICGTDLHIYRWDAWAESRVKPPLIIGHEFIGTIYALGKNVKHLRIGQRVSAEGHITCGRGITGRRMFETWYQCESFLLKNGKVIDPIITHVLDLEDVEKGFMEMEANKAIKVLLKVSK